MVRLRRRLQLEKAQHRGPVAGARIGDHLPRMADRECTLLRH